MSSHLRTITDSLAAGLQSVPWSITGTIVQRKNWANIDAEDMTVPYVIVVPGGADISRISRQNMQADYTVTVFVGRQVQADSDVNAMLDLTDAVMLQVRAHSFTGVTWPAGVTSPQTVTVEINPDDALNERNIWRDVITATYRVFEPNHL